MIPLIDKPRQYEFNRRIIEKSSGHFLIALVVDPVFSPANANGQLIISTRRGMTCRGLLAVTIDRARHCDSNGLNTTNSKSIVFFSAQNEIFSNVGIIHAENLFDI
jgi:hypothetical protein